MKIESVDFVEWDAKQVYPLVRDHIEKIVPFMLNIEKIERMEREEKPQGPRILNHWYAKSKLPAMLSSFLSPELMSWKDFAQWRDADFEVDFELQGIWKPDLYKCKGVNSFKPAGPNRTEVKVTVDLDIYPEKLGIPKFIASRTLPAVESFIKGLLQPNLTSLSKGLQAYFKSQPK